MSKFEFNEDQVNFHQRQTNEAQGFIFKTLLKLDFIKNKQQAVLAMIFIIIVLVIISWFALSSIGNSTNNVPITTEIPDAP